MPLRDDLLNPIAGDNPSGAHLRYAPVFDKIKEARREEDDAPQGDWQRDRKTADSKTVIKLAGETLATKSKDLQLAACITEAQLRLEGFAGLRQGLDLIRGLIEGFWDTLYPEIEDGDLELRVAPVEWVGTRLEDLASKVPITRNGFNFYQFKESRKIGYEEEAAQNDAKRQARETAIAEGKPTADDFDREVAATPAEQYEAWVAAIDGCLESIESLTTVCDEKFGSFAPPFGSLRTAIEEIRHPVNQILQKRLQQEGRGASDEAEPEAEPEEQAGYADQGDSSSGAAPAPRRRASSAGVDPVDVDDATVRLSAIAKFLRQQDGASPGPYLLLRGYRWGELRGYGESPDQTLLEPPPSNVRQNIKRLSIDMNWAELLEVAETAMAQPCGRAWLDLQRYVVRAAESNGCYAIAQAIRSELRALLTDLPMLPTWTLMDDTPTANAETQAWLKEVAAVETTVSESMPSMSDDTPSDDQTPDGEPAPPDTFTLALEAARSGRTSEAIQMLADEIPRQHSGRARFQRKLQLAQICMMTGHESLAQPILEELVACIDSHKLEDWEATDIVAHPLAMLYRCIAKLEDDPAVKQKLYARISRLDPVQALECAR